MRLKNAILRSLFFIGWLLSPATFWNDAFVNIPISYICAGLFVKSYHTDFLFTVLVFYWLSNILGICIMYISGARIFTSGRSNVLREAFKLAIAVAAYSVLLAILGKIGLIKPF